MTERTLLGIWASVVALFLLGKAVPWQQSYGKLVLIVLLIGGIGIGIILVYLWLKENGKRIMAGIKKKLRQENSRGRDPTRQVRP
jgi:pilus assembly protein TadC